MYRRRYPENLRVSPRSSIIDEISGSSCRWPRIAVDSSLFASAEFLRISGLMRRYSVDHPIDKRGPISASHHLPDYTVRLFTITEVAEVLRIPISRL
jgi:hypothetical protein